jgi:hypothetical protein
LTSVFGSDAGIDRFDSPMILGVRDATVGEFHEVESSNLFMFQSSLIFPLSAVTKVRRIGELTGAIA